MTDTAASALRSAPGWRPSGPVVATVLGVSAAATVLLSSGPLSGALDHERPLDGDRALPTLAWFLVGWTLMVLAMMLATTTRLVTTVGRLSDTPFGGVRMQASTLASYLLVWAGIGYLFRAGDVVVHTLVDDVGWLADRPGLVGASVLLVAGAFQLSSLKHRCLTACRTPSSFAYRHWQGGAPLVDAARIGAAYGISCAGCCWALMLVMFAFGLMSPAWMVVFGAVMAIERGTRLGHRLTTPLAVALLAAGLGLGAAALL